jgi:hypothetical protein
MSWNHGRRRKTRAGQARPRLRFSSKRRVEHLHERLELEPNPSVRAVIETQLAAFQRPPAGGYD